MFDEGDTPSRGGSLAVHACATSSCPLSWNALRSRVKDTHKHRRDQTVDIRRGKYQLRGVNISRA